MELINKLKEVFGDCKRIDSSKCIYKTSFEVHNAKNFFVYDDRKTELPVKIVGKRDPYQLTVNNRNKYENDICLVKTDKCLFTTDHKKCDCILFNKKKFFFVEISEAGAGGRGDKRNDAILQLGTTIDLLKKYNVDLSEYEVKAIICFKSGKSRTIQVATTTKQAIFLDTHKVILEEINEISF